MAVRQIIFRGKRKDSGSLIISDSILRYDNVIRLWDTKDGYVEIVPDTLGEYIGLIDKNGIKIFEGDIVKGNWNTIFTVFYDETYLQFRARPQHGIERDIDYYQGHNGLDVIGNVYDNAELVNTDKNEIEES